MPIARTVSGLILFDELDSESGWTWYAGSNEHATHGIDSADKQSGLASLKIVTDGGGTNAYWWKWIDLTSAGIVRIWHKVSQPNAQSYWFQAFFIFGKSSVYGTSLETGTGPYNHAWQRETWTVLSDVKSLQKCEIDVTSGANLTGRVDKLTIATSNNLTVTGLTPGQKVEIYRSADSSLVGNATCAGGQSSVTIDISSSDYYEQLYFKVYATDGSTLIETTTSYDMCGGDTWDWTTGAGTLKISVDADVIYRTAAAGTPKTCNITANLKTLGGANYPGATIYFTTTLGSLDDASDVTDASGNAHTELTSAAYGIAVIKANWLGDASVPACSAYYTVHVFYEAEAPDTAKDFQFYIEGIEYVYVSGRYTQNELGAVNDFEVEIPEWLSTITINGFVNIYRKGTKEFHGILKMPNQSLSDNPRVVLKGPDVSVLLNDAIADTKIYGSKTPQFIINDLLTSFVCGIYPGSLGSCATSLTITIETESLAKAIPRVCDLVGWKFRVNMNRTLDFAESFTGGTTSASFTEGEDLVIADRQRNFSTVANYVRMKGSGIYSTKQDGTKIQQQGLHQAPAFNKSISNQATLDAACQAYLDMKKVEEETIPAEVIDKYDPGTFGPEDYITVTSATTGLSGTYQVRKIERKLEDANYAKLDLSNKTKEYWELDTEYRRMTKDANV